VCYATREENARLVKEFVDRYNSTPDRKFDCYYDSETTDNVVDHKVYTRWDVVHCMLWPSVLLIACAIAFLYLELEQRSSGTAAGGLENGHDIRQTHSPSMSGASRPPPVPRTSVAHADRGRPTG
jgi:hypothetical protein